MGVDGQAGGAKRKGRPSLLLLNACIVLVVALTVLCLWANRKPGPGNEISAIGGLKAYCEAQQLYKKTDWDGDGKFGYADALDKLAAVGLVEKGFAEARGTQGKPWHGYLFLECGTIAGQAVDWSSDFAICAIPARYGRTGYRSFIMCTNGTVFPKDQGPESRFASDYPADIIAEAWWPFE